MKTRRLAYLGATIICLLPGIAPADFLPSDFSVTTRVQAVGTSVPTVDRTTVTNGSFSDIAGVTGVKSSGSAFGTGGLSLGASAAADSTGFGGSGLAQVTVLNQFMVIPNAGYTGTTASVSLPFFLEGSLSVNGNVGLPGCAPGSGICGNGEADVLASLTVLSGVWTGDGGFSSDSIHHNLFTPGGGTLAISETGLLTGTVPVNTSIAVQVFLQTLAVA